MKFGLQIPYLSWPGGPDQLGATLVEVGRTAEAAGYDSLWLMDHFFQIPGVGRAEEDMIEAYTGLSFLAGSTSRVKLGSLVTGVTYRHPGLLIKQVTSLDVLSRGRAILGIGAAWYEREHLGLGVAFPPLRQRFQMLEEALQIAGQMWSGETGRFDGKHYQLAETMNVPQPLSRPHPPILIGGGGERKTLRLVAKYADACNVFVASPEQARHKFDVIRQHCEAVGRNYDEIERTIYFVTDVTEPGSAAKIVDSLGQFAEAGVQMVIGAVANVHTIAPLETIGRDIIPQARNL